MLEVKVIDNSIDNKVEAGQIRYNGEGLIVLIVGGELFSAVLLDGGVTTKAPYYFAIRNKLGYEITELFPYVATGKLEITK